MGRSYRVGEVQAGTADDGRPRADAPAIRATRSAPTSTGTHDLTSLARHVERTLRTRLGRHLHYHDAAHTLEDVVPAADRLAAAEGLSRHARVLVHAAALLHDTGYIEGPEEHEAASARIAASTLPAYGFDEAEIAVVARLILATKLGATPATVEERILADADLDLLGRADYWVRSQDLRREWAAGGRVFDDRTWVRDQLRFLEEHSYRTASARASRQAGKMANARDLRAYLSEPTANPGGS